MHDRIVKPVKSLFVRVLQIAPLAATIAVVSYFVAKQIASPNQRMIKMGVLGAMLIFMFRFDMIYSVFAFTLLFPFPSGITIGSTNSIMMTLIALAWAIRATSTGQRVVNPTRYDWALVFLVLAYVMSFYNTTDNRQIVLGLHVLWKQIAAIMYFYAIIMFVNDEKRLIRLTKVIGAMLTVVVSSGIIELFAPGSTLVPGWLNLHRSKMMGKFGYRIEGLRLEGVVHAHNVLSDMATLGALIMTYLFLRARNPLERFLWMLGSLASVTVLMGTANRGAFLSIVFAIVYLIVLFRRRISFARAVIVCAAIVGVFVVTQLVLDRYTFAASMTDRLLHTKMEGLTPDTRVGVWKPAFMKSFEHPFIGHGPFFDTGGGLNIQYWPHNGYIYYFYTIGLAGLGAYLWFCTLLVKRSLIFRRPEVRNTTLGELATLFHGLLVMMLLGQLRTDHQRDDINMHLVYLCFALVAATAEIIDRQARAPAPALGDTLRLDKAASGVVK